MLNSNFTFTLICFCYRKVSAYFKVWLVKRMSVFAIGSTLAHLLLSQECGTPPHIQGMLLYVTQFYQAFPALLPSLYLTGGGSYVTENDVT